MRGAFEAAIAESPTHPLVSRIADALKRHRPRHVPGWLVIRKGKSHDRHSR